MACLRLVPRGLSAPCTPKLISSSILTTSPLTLPLSRIGPEEEPRYLIKKQEDLIQTDSLAAALVPQPFSPIAVLLTRLTLRLFGLFFIYVYGTLFWLLRMLW